MEVNDEPRVPRRTTAKLLQADFMPANLQRAKKYVEETSIRTNNGKKVKFCQTIHMFQEYSLGVYLYLSFLKKMIICMAIAGAISLIPLISNILGKYFTSTDSSSIFDQTTLGNQVGIKFKEQNQGDAQNSFDQQNVPKFLSLFSDIAYSAVLVIFLVYFKFKMQIQIQKDRQTRSSARHYAISVKGLPKYNLTEHQVKQFFQTRFGKVVEVVFAREYGDSLNKFTKRANLIKKIQIRKVKLSIKGQLNNVENDEKIKKLQQKLSKLDEKIAAKHPDINSIHDLPINRAFLIFQNAEDKMACLRTYVKLNRCRLCCYCCCRQKQQFTFEGKRLKIEEPDEPDAIKWENLEITRCGRAWRKCLIVVIGLVAFLIGFVFIYYLKFIQLNSVTNEQCINFPNISSQTVQQTALGDHRNCWCKDFGISNVISNSQYRDTYCYDYLLEYIEETSLQAGLSFIIIEINFILKIVMRSISFFIRYQSVNAERTDSMLNMFLVLFINTGILILVINGNLKETFFGTALTNIPVLGQYFMNGDYPDFTRNWFIYVGSSIIIIMFVNIIMPPLTGYMFYILKKFTRCCCKGRAIIQKDLNAIFKGPEYDIAYSGAQFLANFYITMLYCNSLPILILLFLVYAFFRYWTDKCLLLRHYCTPPAYDDRFPRKILSAMPYAVLLHMVMSVWVYTSPYIYPSSFSMKDKNGTMVYQADLHTTFFHRFFQGYTIPMLISIAAFCFLYGLTSIFFRVFRCCCKQQRELSLKILQGTFTETKQNIKGLTSYSPQRNDKYRLLITSMMKILKSGKHQIEAVESMIKESYEDELMKEEEVPKEIDLLAEEEQAPPQRKSKSGKRLEQQREEEEGLNQNNSVNSNSEGRL